jgi:hypothetical protein
MLGLLFVRHMFGAVLSRGVIFASGHGFRRPEGSEEERGKIPSEFSSVGKINVPAKNEPKHVIENSLII